MLPIVRAAHQALSFHLEQCSTISDKKILIIQGQVGNYLEALKGCEITALSYDAAHHYEWKQAGITSVQSIAKEKSYDVVIQFGSKSESETRLALAKYALLLKENGRFISIVHNKLGAGRYKKQFEQLFSDIAITSKSKSRVLDGIKDESFNTILAEDWVKLEKPSILEGSDYLSLPGVYGEKKLDAGSIFLSELLQNEYWSGRGADLGAGYGYLAGELLKNRHKIQELHLYEIDSRALEMAQLNLSKIIEKSCNTVKSIKTHWCDVTQAPKPERSYHWAIMNPPFHTSTEQNFDLGIAFIQQAAVMLRDGAPLFMVANLHLPYEETLHESFRSVVKLGERDGFKAFRAVK